MSVIDTLIYDRVQQDLINETDKAYISYIDLNRIESAVKYLSDLLNTYGYRNITTNKTDWKIDELRKQEDCDRIKSNYQILKGAYAYKFTMPDFNWSTIQEANNIEKILADIEVLIKNMEHDLVFCGVANFGQNRIWQQRFRRTHNWNSMVYAISKYNQEWHSLAVANNIVGNLKTSGRDDIKSTINAWNDYMECLDKKVGGVE